MKICLNCGCGMGKDTDTNCPVCNHAYKKEDIGNLPFGEKGTDTPAEVKNENNISAPTGQRNSSKNI